MTVNFIILSIIAYFLGSINCAMITCHFFGLPSPRSAGSGNPGATNVLRLGSKPAAAITLLGDLLKGVIPVVIAHYLFHHASLIAFIGLAAVIGHMFPLWYGFKGGKGVATTLGVLLALSPIVGITFVVTWLIIAFLFRYSSLAALIAVILAPFYAWIEIGFGTLLPLAIIAVLVTYRHHENIRRLLAKTESQIRFKK